MYQTFGSFSGTLTLNPRFYSTAVLTLSGNITFTIATTSSDPGDLFTLVVIQGGVGSFTTAFVNTKIAGASFIPTAAVGAISKIVFEFDGTNWIEHSRGLNLS